MRASSRSSRRGAAPGASACAASSRCTRGFSRPSREAGPIPFPPRRSSASTAACSSRRSSRAPSGACGTRRARERRARSSSSSRRGSTGSPTSLGSSRGTRRAAVFSPTTRSSCGTSSGHRPRPRPRSPRDAAPVAARQETAAIRAALAPLVRSGHVKLEVLASATPAALHRKLSDGGVDVLHFVGHGAFDEKEKTGSLFLVDARGRALAVDTDRVLRLFSGRGLKLVFLNACETGRGGRTDFLRGVAPALLAGGVPAVLANQYKVLDSSATAFARHLYWGLAKGRTLGAAAREARVAVSYAKGAEPMDWAVPVLYARDTSLVFRGPRRAPKSS
ncbi:MAG TPA: CHAT domain-containing protein [Thermoanaerobaculia bacterium]